MPAITLDNGAKQYKVYGLFDPRDGQLKYIGMTSTPLSARLSVHHATAKKSNLKRPCSSIPWLKELLALNLKSQIMLLESFDTLEGAYEAEKWNIAYFRSIGCNLVNMSDGGAGPNGTKRSEKTRKKMGDAKRDIPKTKDHRTNLAKSGGGKPFTDSFGNTYHNIHEAGEKLGIAWQNIWKVLKGRRPHTCGVTFAYL